MGIKNNEDVDIEGEDLMIRGVEKSIENDEEEEL